MNPETDITIPEAELSDVKCWLGRIKKAKEYWKEDFDRMIRDMEFVRGFQWPGQTVMDSAKYTANFVNTFVNNKVASLYARNPKCSAERRERMDYQVWDESIESLQTAIIMAQTGDPASLALIQDYTAGRLRRDLVNRVGKSLKIAHQYQWDSVRPKFKLQMKQLVRRTITCGVGYVRVDFESDAREVLSSSDVGDGATTRASRLINMSQTSMKEPLEDDDPDIKTGERILESLQEDMEETPSVSRANRLVYDFIPSTSVIIDTKCRSLQGFVAARWLAIEYELSLEEMNSHFGLNIEPGAVTEYDTEGDEAPKGQDGEGTSTTSKRERIVCVYEVLDRTTKSQFFLCKGYKGYIQSPQPLHPKVRGFWPIRALTFNDTESDESTKKTSIFPPSDVQLIRSAQIEWNHSRNVLKHHRKGNAPQMMTVEGWLTDDDKIALEDNTPNKVLLLKTAASMNDVTKLLVPVPRTPIDPAVYDNSHLVQDMLLTGGNQEGSVPASPQSTATAATINEQQRVTKNSSNVDDLDDFLSDLAEMGSEVMLMNFNEEVIAAIVGAGYAWVQSEESRQSFAEELYLDVVAASSGRPNKALEMSNWQIAAPILQAAGASPYFMVEETLKRLEEHNLDVDRAFRVSPAVPQQPQQQNQNGQKAPGHGGRSAQGAGQQPAATILQPSPTPGRMN